MKVRAFITHKQSENFSDCQDRFSISRDSKSIALSDGMSQSFFQHKWAEILCQKFVDDKSWIPSHDTIIPLCEQWDEAVKQHLDNEEKKGNPFLYLIKNAVNGHESAGATFVGIRINGFSLSYNVLGDSCLIKLSNGCAINSLDDIISSQTGEFDSYPDFFDSNATKKGKGEVKYGGVQASTGDVFLLVSDPFSDLFYEKVSNHDDCQSMINEILELKGHEDYETLIKNWRNGENMHNDDSTLVILEFDGKEEFEIIYADNINSLVENTDIIKEIPPKSNIKLEYCDDDAKKELEQCRKELEQCRKELEQYEKLGRMIENMGSEIIRLKEDINTHHTRKNLKKNL